MEAKHDFDKASKTIKSEMARFERERVEDLRDTLLTFLEGMVSRQTEVGVADFDFKNIYISFQIDNTSMGKLPINVIEQSK